MRIVLQDLRNAFGFYKEIAFLGALDVKQRYRRSALGPVWITIATALNIAGLAIVFGTVFQAPLRDYVPYLACGIVLWSYFTTLFLEASDLLLEQRQNILERRISFFELSGRLLFRNFYIFLHNYVFLLALIVIFQKFSFGAFILSAIGFILVSVCMFFVSIIFSIMGARFRDLTPIVSSFLQMGFYFTPIVWEPALMEERGRSIMVDANPFYHLIQTVRGPMLGDDLPVLSYVVVIALIVMLAPLSVYFIHRYGPRVSYWM